VVHGVGEQFTGDEFGISQLVRRGIRSRTS
jgi:hypothetical protein